MIFLPENVIDFIENDISKKDNIRKIIHFIETSIIKQPQQCQRLPATVITIYNNKGGVGKTTTVSYLSYLLRKKSNHLRQKMNRVLAIDYDHNQANLTKRFGFDKTDGETKELLLDAKEGKNVSQLQLKYIKQVKFKDKELVIDFLAADRILCEEEETYDNLFNFDDNCLKKLCLEFSKSYDYIIIDTSPGWEQSPYTRAAVTAADCLLPLGKWGDFDSFDGYRSIICEKLPEVVCKNQHDMKPDKPDNLGLWITDSRDSDKSGKVIKDMTINEFKYHISQAESNKEELRRGFFSSQNANELQTIKHSALILKSSCHNPELRGDFFKTCHHNTIDKVYEKLLNSFIGD